MGVVLTAGTVLAVTGGVPTVEVTVPDRVGGKVAGTCDAVDVGGGIVFVGALVAVITIGVLLGARVGVGMDWRVCSTCAATVACMSGITGAGLVGWD